MALVLLVPLVCVVPDGAGGRDALPAIAAKLPSAPGSRNRHPQHHMICAPFAWGIGPACRSIPESMRNGRPRLRRPDVARREVRDARPESTLRARVCAPLQVPAMSIG